jgi:zinc protease
VLKAPIDPKGLVRSKTQLIASTIYRRDSQYAMASAYAQALAIGLTTDDVDEWPARVRAVSADAVRRAGQTLNRREAVTAYLKSAVLAESPRPRPMPKQAAARP